MQGVAHAAAGDDQVEEAVLEEELGALEVFGQFLGNGALDDAPAGKADQRAGLRDQEVAEAGEAGGDAAGRRVGEHGDVEQAGLVVTADRGRGLGHLHQGDDALLHAGAAGGREDDDRQALLGGALEQAGDLFADDGTHRGHHEAAVHGRSQAGQALDGDAGADDGLGEAGALLEGGELFLVAGKADRVGAGQAGVELLDRILVRHQRDALPGVEAVVEAAVRADRLHALEVVAEHGAAAARAAHPQVVGNRTRLSRSRGFLQVLCLDSLLAGEKGVLFQAVAHVAQKVNRHRASSSCVQGRAQRAGEHCSSSSSVFWPR